MQQTLKISKLQQAALNGLCAVGRPAQFVVEKETGRWACKETQSMTPFVFLFGVKFLIDRLAQSAANSDNCVGRFALTPRGMSLADDCRLAVRFVVDSTDASQDPAFELGTEFAHGLVA